MVSQRTGDRHQRSTSPLRQKNHSLFLQQITIKTVINQTNKSGRLIVTIRCTSPALEANTKRRRHRFRNIASAGFARFGFYFFPHHISLRQCIALLNPQ